jgi:hypothetical protein
MNLQEKNRLEFLWPNTFTENGRKLARNEGILAAICFTGQYFIGLDAIFQKIDTGGGASFELDKYVYLLVIAVLLFLAWRISRWGWISSIVVGVWAVLEFAVVMLNATAPPVWNFVVIYLAFHGIRGCLAQKKVTIPIPKGENE